MSRFTLGPNDMRYDAAIVGNMAMLRRSSDNSLSGLPPSPQTISSERAERTRDPATDSMTPMEEKMSSQTLVNTNIRRPNHTVAALAVLIRPVVLGLAAFAVRFMKALHESRQRQADAVIRRYRHLTDRRRD